MSETVHYRGSIEEVYPPEGVTMKQHLTDLIVAIGIPYDPISIGCGYTDEDGFIEIYAYEEYYYHRKTKTLYQYVEKKELDAEGDIIEAFENEDNTIGFELRFYNGGAGLEECLDEAIDKLNKQRQ